MWLHIRLSDAAAIVFHARIVVERRKGGGLLINAIYAGIDETRERNVAVCIEEGREGGGFNCTEFLLARAERAPNKTLISVFDYTQTDRSEYGSGIPLPRRKLGTTTRDQLSLIRIDRRWPAG